MAATFQDVPDFFYSAVPDGPRYLAGGESNVDHAGPSGAVSPVNEEADLRAVGCDRVGI